MIDKQLLFKLFEETKQKEKTKIKPRDIFKKAKEYLAYKEILAITGVRRSGKTSLMFQLMQDVENKIYLNFEDERFAYLEAEDLDKIFEYYFEYANPKGKVYFFFDEIQNVPMWEKWLSRSYEKYKFIISGSNSKLLSSELASSITGRHIELKVYPMSFQEFAIIPKELTTENIGKLKHQLTEYIDKGGFPEVILHNKTELLKEYYNDILFRDVIARNNIKYKLLLERLAIDLASNIGKQASLYSLSKKHDVGINTVKNYIHHLEQSYLFCFIHKYSHSFKKQLQAPIKVYGIDTGLIKEIGFRASEDGGRFIENIVYLELLRRNKRIFYHKEMHECDFVIQEKGSISQAIQVTKELKENKERELNGLIEACKTHKLSKGLCITMDQEEEFVADSIQVKVIPLWKWLLE